MGATILEERARRAVDAIVEDLEVPASRYEEARDRYKAVTSWLADDEGLLGSLNPTLYPQGSFALGTAVKPINGSDYDVDVVCQLSATPDAVSQQQLKAAVGDRLLSEKSRYRRMIDPATGGRRCWTIRYADESQFHMDVLPAIPDPDAIGRARVSGEEYTEFGILITDSLTWNTHSSWPHSNPKGFARWFGDRMSQHQSVMEARRAMAKSFVEPLEVPALQSPLQRVVQVLKRHRDTVIGDDDDKPVSIALTTLAAKAYSGEGDIYSALRAVTPRMRTLIEYRAGKYWIGNPVDPRENFADKWNESPRKRQLFIEWLDRVDRDLDSLLQDVQSEALVESIEKAFGRPTAKAVGASAFGMIDPSGVGTGGRIVVPAKALVPPPVVVRLPENPPKPWHAKQHE